MQKQNEGENSIFDKTVEISKHFMGEVFLNKVKYIQDLKVTKPQSQSTPSRIELNSFEV